MARPSIPKDRDALRSIIEAMIFAAEEPLSPRTLLSLLYEEQPAPRVIPEAPLFDKEEAGDADSIGADSIDADSINVTGDLADDNASRQSNEVDAVESAFAESAFAPPGRGDEREVRGGITVKELKAIVAQLNEEYERSARSFRIIEIAGGFQFATTREFGEFVGLLSKERARRKLSPASLETLSIIAYRQPVTKPEVEAIRGVNCDQVLLSLLERNLIAITGRGDSVGRPLLYGTTAEFLRAFGLNGLDDLPRLRELEELMEADAHMATPPEVIPAEVTQELLELDDEGNEMGEEIPDDAVEVSDDESDEASNDTSNASIDQVDEERAGPSDAGTIEEAEIADGERR